MEQRHKGNYTFRQQIIDELLVKCYAGGVYGIVSASERNNTRPGDREAVRLGTCEFEECDIFCGAVVRVAGYISRGAIGDLPGDCTEGVPDGGATAICGGGTFNLVAITVNTQSTGRVTFDLRCCCEAPEEVFGKHWFCHLDNPVNFNLG